MPSVLADAMQLPSGWKIAQVTGPSWSENEQTHSWLLTSQVLQTLSSLPDTANRASALNSTERIQLLCPSNEAWNLRVGTDQILIDLSSEPVISFVPSEEKPTLRTEPAWPLSTLHSPFLHKSNHYTN